MDFNPGGFLHATKESFKFIDDGPAPMVMGTRCYQLAMLVVYESALQVICDSPYNYRNQGGLDFLKIVPTTWDDRKVILGQIGDFISIARKSGEDWFIGSMTDWTQRELTIPLNFLAGGKYKAYIWNDAPEANTYPDRLSKEEKIVSAKDFIKASMAPGGGQTVYLTPIK